MVEERLGTPYLAVGPSAR